MGKLVADVLDAARNGLNTTRDIAETTGWPLASVSATVSDLIRDGALRRTGRVIKGEQGKALICFEPAEEKTS